MNPVEIADPDAVDENEHQEFAQHVGLPAVPERPEPVGDPGENGRDARADEARFGFAVRHRAVHQVVRQSVVNDEGHTADGTEFGYLAPKQRGEPPDTICKCVNHDPPWPYGYCGPHGQRPILARLNCGPQRCVRCPRHLRPDYAEIRASVAPESRDTGALFCRLAHVTFPVIGVVGGGQLARMMAPAATALGFELRVLAEAEDVSAVSAVPNVAGGRLQGSPDPPRLRGGPGRHDVRPRARAHGPPA